MMSEDKFKWVAVVSALPVLMWPLLLVHVDQLNTATERFLLLAMPVFVLLCSYLARSSYDERPEVAWVLIAVLWLSYAGFAQLCL